MMKSFHAFLMRHGLAAALVLFLLMDLLIVRGPGRFLAQAHGVRFWVNYGLSFIGLWTLLFLIQRLVNARFPVKIIAFLVFFIPFLVQAGYTAVYCKFVTPFAFSFFAENPWLVITLNREFFPLLKAVILLPVCAYAFLLLWQSAAHAGAVKTGAAAFFFLGFLAHSLFGWYSFYDFENAPMAFYSAGLENAFRGAGTFRINRAAIPAPPPFGKGQPPSVVWIIGESTVLSHMSLFGYPLPTTPGLDSLNKAGQVAIFTNALSVGNKTNLSVPYMLAGLEGPDPTGRFYQSPTIWDYAKARGYVTAFMTAQDFRWGHLDKILVNRNVDCFEQGSRFSSAVDVMKGADDLLVLNQGLLPFLDTAHAPVLLVYQMNGSHYPYDAHCPPAYKRFLPETGENSIPAFDNSVVYTDLVVTRLVNHMRNRFPKSWLFFSPDHGQGLGGEGGLFNDGFLNDIIHNPLIVFPPDSMLRVLKRNENAPVSQADIFATILALLNIAPIRPINGLSLLDSIPSDRLRLCSEYMPTYHNNPSALLFYPDGSHDQIDFTKESVTRGDGTVIPLGGLPERARNYINLHLEAVR